MDRWSASRLWYLSAFVIIAALLAAGCGSGSLDSSNESIESISQPTPTDVPELADEIQPSFASGLYAASSGITLADSADRIRIGAETVGLVRDLGPLIAGDARMRLSVGLVAFAPDGNTLASPVQMEIIEDGFTLAEYLPPGLSTANLADAGFDEYYASGTLLWNVNSGYVHSWILRWSPNDGLAFSPDGQLLAGITRGDSSSDVALWDITVRPVREVTGSINQVCRNVRGFAFSPHGQTLGLICDEPFSEAPITVNLWQHSTQATLGTFTPRVSKPRSIAFSADGSLVAVVGHEGVEAWDVTTGQPVALLLADEERGGCYDPGLTNISFSPDGRLLAASYWSCTFGGMVQVWSMEGGHTLQIIEGQVKSFQFSPDSRFMVANLDDNCLRFYDTSNYELMTRVCPENDRYSSFVFLDISRNGALVATSLGSSLRLFGVPYVPPVNDLTAVHIEEVHRIRWQTANGLISHDEAQAKLERVESHVGRDALIWVVRNMPVYDVSTGQWMSNQQIVSDMTSDWGAGDSDARVAQDPIGTAVDLFIGNYTLDEMQDWMGFSEP